MWQRTCVALLLLVISAGTASALIAPPAPSFDPEAATQQYLSQIPPDVRARSDAYFTGGYWLELITLLYGLGVAWLLLASGWSARWRDALSARLRRPALRTAAYLACYAVAVFVLSLPLTIYQDFYREHAYGFATQGFGAWFGDQLVEQAVFAVGLAVSFTLLYALIRRLGERWWIWGTAVSVVLLAVMVFLSPVVLDPLLNTYSPMPEGPVKTEVLRIARANGIPADNVYMVDDSRQHNRVSARVTGIGSTVRISLNDNLLQRATPAGVVATMGHEMGHYVLNHVWEMLIEFGLLIALGFRLLHGAYGWAQRRWGQRFRIGGIGDEAGFPLLMALLAVYFYLATPVINTIIRTNETEADYFGLNASQEPDGFAETILLTAEYRKPEPAQWEEFLFYNHPSPRTRIFNAMTWKAAQLQKQAIPATEPAPEEPLEPAPAEPAADAGP